MNNNKPNKESAREGAFSLIFNSVIPREYYYSVIMIVVLGTNTPNRQKNISSEASLGGGEGAHPAP